MSSEALKRLRTSARVHHTNGDVTLTALSSDVDALLAALADARERAEKAEQERDEALSVREGLISPVQKVLQLRDALAVVREREQRAVEALDDEFLAEAGLLIAALRVHAASRVGRGPELCGRAADALESMLAARAAMVDENPMEPSGEPAAATLAEPERERSGQTQTKGRASRLSPGSASAAADEPGETPCC